jgi:hypothetical protein
VSGGGGAMNEHGLFDLSTPRVNVGSTYMDTALGGLGGANSPRQQETTFMLQQFRMVTEIQHQLSNMDHPCISYLK